MTITIFENTSKNYITLGCEDPRFVREYGNLCEVNTSDLYKNLSYIASWVNNSLGEECLFEID